MVTVTGNPIIGFESDIRFYFFGKQQSNLSS